MPALSEGGDQWGGLGDLMDVASDCTPALAVEVSCTHIDTSAAGIDFLRVHVSVLVTSRAMAYYLCVARRLGSIVGTEMLCGTMLPLVLQMGNDQAFATS